MTNQGSSSTQAWTNRRRHAHYQLRSQTSLRLLAAVGGLSVIGTGDLAGSNLNAWWAAVVVTLLLAAGGCLAMSWSTFSHGERVLKGAMDSDADLTKETWVKGQRYDPNGEALYRAGTVVIALAGFALVSGYWWNAVASAIAT